MDENSDITYFEGCEIMFVSQLKQRVVFRLFDSNSNYFGREKNIPVARKFRGADRDLCTQNAPGYRRRKSVTMETRGAHFVMPRMGEGGEVD